jgi:hypothetical protein
VLVQSTERPPLLAELSCSRIRRSLGLLRIRPRARLILSTRVADEPDTRRPHAHGLPCCPDQGWPAQPSFLKVYSVTMSAVARTSPGMTWAQASPPPAATPAQSKLAPAVVCDLRRRCASPGCVRLLSYMIPKVYHTSISGHRRPLEGTDMARTTDGQFHAHTFRDSVERARCRFCKWLTAPRRRLDSSAASNAQRRQKSWRQRVAAAVLRCRGCGTRTTSIPRRHHPAHH